MDIYYNRLASIPMRKEANHRSEMISELICGEPFWVILREKDWIKIQTKLDSYTAWIAANQFVPFKEPASVLIDQVQFFDDDQRLIGYMSGYFPASEAKI